MLKRSVIFLKFGTMAFLGFVLSLFFVCGAFAAPAGESASVVVVEPPLESSPSMPPAVTVTEGGVPVRVVRQRASQDIAPRQPSSPASAGQPEVSSQDRSVQIQNPALLGSEVGRWTPRHKALLVRDPQFFLNAALFEDLLEGMAADKFSRLLLHVDLRQTDESGAESLNAALSNAMEKGIGVDLFSDVGEAVARDDWQENLTHAASFPFRALHLDFGTDGHFSEPKAAQLTGIVKSVREAAGRPVSISAPASWLEGDNAAYAASLLHRMNVSEIILKFYSTDAEATARRFSMICRSYPTLNFSLLQSVERNRPRTESYFTAGVTIFDRRMQKLCFDVATTNALDLVIQDWESYSAMER